AAESSLATAERELERARSLRERGIVAEAELDLRRTRRDTARAERDRAGEQLAELEAGTREEQLARARATAGAAEAAAARAAYGVAELEVRAPVAGVVDALPFEPGGRPRAGDTVAVLLAEGAPY